jgi:RNA polymerase sigma-70 factor (ECF subfamily)
MQRDLVERARRGDREAFGSIAENTIDRLHAVARLVLRDPDLAEDAVQETLLRCWRRLPQLRDPDRFEAWQYRILMRTVADEFARRRRFQNAVQQIRVEPSDGDRIGELLDRDQLERLFRTLSIEHRSIVVLHHFAGLPLHDVAEVLGIRPGTAKSRYHYAMGGLRAALDAESRLDDVVREVRA